MKDYIDEYIRVYVEKEETVVPLHTKQVINKTLLELEKQSKVKTIFRLKRSTLVAIALGAATIGTTVFATDLPSQIISSISSFFEKASFAKYKGDSKVLQDIEQQVEFGLTREGIQLQVDSVALDDNFLNIFYTLKSEEPIPKQDEQGNVAWLYAPGIELRIDGEPWEYMGNGQDRDGYLEDEYTLKGMERINVAHLQLPDAFELEINFIEPYDKAGKWTINVPVQKIKIPTRTVIVDKSYQIKTNSYSRNHEGKTNFDITIDKVIFSPLASQIIIKERNVGGEEAFDQFVFFDQDGNSLERITQWVGTTIQENSNESTNGFEFIPTEGLKKIVVVPITRYEMEEEIKEGITYDEQYRYYEETYPIKIEIPIDKIPITINRGPLISYEFLDIKIEEENMLIEFKINGAPVDHLIKSEVYPLDENKEWIMDHGLKSLSIDRETGIYTLRLTNGIRNEKRIDFTKAKYLTLDDGGYLLPEQLLWEQAIEIDVAEAFK